MKHTIWLPGLLVLTLSAGPQDPTPQTPQENSKHIDFACDVLPILKESCYRCHSAGTAKRGVPRLDQREGIMTYVVAGKSAESRLYEVLVDENAESRMPRKAAPLAKEKIAIIKAWIDQGAARSDAPGKHWAYVKPMRCDSPKVRNAGWIRNPIDNFVLARLEKEGLSPSPEAPRETLLRRLSLDLTGLPPTIKEIDDFLADKSSKAYEKVVDRLLASPHYGERWARPWLDLARYADTNGHEKDVRRTMWKYRDWVIQALNRDMPFDRFTLEQIAGDMLPNPTLDQRIATGFHRNTMLNEEGGVDPAEDRWVTLVDRVNTTGSVWLGTTIGCAQCHNHKYDPFTQKEFYQLLAFFENSDTPTIEAPTADQEARRKKLSVEVAQLETVLRTRTGELDAAQADWEKRQTLWTRLPPEESASQGGATLTKLADGSLLASGVNPEKDTWAVTVRTDLKGISAFLLELLADKSLPAAGPGRAGNGNFVLTEFRVLQGTDKTAVPLVRAKSDFAQEGFPVEGAIDGKVETGWAISPQMGQSHAAIFEPQENVAGDILTFVLECQSVHGQHTIGRMRLSATTEKNPTPPPPDPIREILQVPAEKRSGKQVEDLAAYYRSISPLLNPARDRIANLRKQIEGLGIVTALVMQERPSSERPSTFLRIRGGYLSKGDKVYAGVPGSLHALPESQLPNRLGLARWLVDENNPLTARVAVNRFWEQFFGRGIVETSEDFGSQGTAPTHPELLDWLATEFVRLGWSMKKIHRAIVMSATYRQSSRVTPELREKDPYNRLYARGPRFRMEAEMIRDSSLVASGLLSRKVGGPPVFPPQPEGIWNIPYNADKWMTNTGEDRYRRGLYTFWRRTAPYPAFTTFDAPSREFCTVRRVRTNTPLQSLTVLNDPMFFEAAAALGRRMAVEGGADARTRATYGFRLCLARVPTAKELDTLVALYQTELDRFSKDTASAKAALRSLNPPDSEAPSLAAWAVVANVILNLDEAVTKE